MVEVDSGRGRPFVAAGSGHSAPVGDRCDPRLLFLVPFTPSPDAHHGGGRVVAQLLLRLARRHRVGVVFLARPDGEPLGDELTDACELVVPVEPRRGRSRWRARRDALLAPLTGVPSAVAAVREPGFTAACLKAVGDWHPDLVQVEQDSIGYLGRVIRDADADPALVLVCHEPGGRAAADQARATSGRQRFAHRLDEIAWHRHWPQALAAFDAVVAFTGSDRDAVAEEADVRTAVIGVGVEIPPEPLGSDAGGEPRVAYVGGYAHPPNTDAALRLLGSIMPAVRSRRPGLKLLLVGADPGPAISAAAGPDDVITGSVAAVEPYIAAATLVVLPIRLGGGMRVKLLEAMAAGKPIVTTRLAAAGLDLTDGAEVAFAETDEEFAAAILALIDDAGSRRRLGAEARRWAAANLGWDSRVREYEDLYETLLGVAS